MPRFPTYSGELPAVLNPFNLHHYFLLAYWIFFRPTALKCYLYQADAALYRTKPDSWKQLLAHLKQSVAYRTPVLMMPFLSLLITLFVSGGVNLILQTAGFDIHLGKWLGGVAVGVVGGVASGVAGGAAVGVALGVAVGVAGGVAFGVAGGVAVGVLYGGLLMLISVLPIEQSSEMFGAGLAIFISMPASALRLWVWPLQWPIARFANLKNHPVLQDEFMILPLPNTQQLLLAQIQQSFLQTLDRFADYAANPFMRPAVQTTLNTYFADLKAPLQFLYIMLKNKQLENFAFAPLVPWQWEYIATRRQVLLAVFACQPIQVVRNSELLMWRFLKYRCQNADRPLPQFARLLYALIERKRAPAQQILNQPWAQAAYTRIRHYPNGEEVFFSYEAMRTFLNYQNLLELPGAMGKSPPAPLLQRGEDEVLRPTVLTALQRLAEVGGEVAAYRDSTSRAGKLAALARANDTLESLKTYVTEEINEAEAYVLREIIDHWQPMITQAGGEAGRAELRGPVENPYVAGNPVTGDLFVGRDDIMTRLEELWGNSSHCPSVIVYGHRRMGKTSILHNLGERFGPRLRVVYFNMQVQGRLRSSNELLYNLALACSDVTGSAEPEEARFLEHNPYTAFNRYLKEIDRHRGGMKLLIAIDEFEIIEEGIHEGIFDAELQRHWRGLFQTTPWLVMAFAGLHTLQEMTADYWQPLFGSVTPIRVGFLEDGAARALITNPSPDFDLDYDADAIDAILHFSHGQPYLLQLLCHCLVSRFNRRQYEEDVEPPRRFSRADVEAVLASEALFLQGNAYFNGVWQQADADQQALLQRLAQHGELEVAAVDAEALAALEGHDVVGVANGRVRYRVPLMAQWVRQLM